MEVYFDNSATTKPYDEVIDAVAYAMKNYFGNPSSAHKLGVIAEQKLNEYRSIIAETINCKADEIVFTSGGSESNNFAIKGIARAGGHVITTAIEHPSVLKTFHELEEAGVNVTYLNLDNAGLIKPEELEMAVNKDTQLVSIMHVNNEIGAAQDLERISKIVREKSSRAKLHIDAVQSYGKLPIDVQKLNIDLLSASAHKLHGPRGIGFLYIRKGLMPKPLICGGGQERSFRSGTENLPGAAGFAAAAEKVCGNRQSNFMKVSRLKDYFISRLKEVDAIRINSFDDYSPYILSVSFAGVKSEVLLHGLEEKGIYVSAGSACSAKRNKESHVLKAIGLSDKDIEGTIRFSFSEENDEAEVDYTVENLKSVLGFLRRLRG